MGKKHQPFYRIVVADSRAPRDGRSIETIGHYNPLPSQEELVVQEERLFHWLDQGAEPSDTVKSLMRNRGITLKYELISRNADEATIKKELSKWEMARDERAKRFALAREAKAGSKAKAVEVEEVVAAPAPAPVTEAPAKAEVAEPVVETEPAVPVETPVEAVAEESAAPELAVASEEPTQESAEAEEKV
jgi:small subunit ribosomal protein S16